MVYQVGSPSAARTFAVCTLLTVPSDRITALFFGHGLLATLGTWFSPHMRARHRD